jgi:Flp pilus assembly protein TadB
MKGLPILTGAVALALAVQGWAATESTATDATASISASPAGATKVKYKSGKELRFDELLIQGQMKRAEMSIVTGDPAELSDGLLRLRENFLDHAAADLGEEVQ